MSSLLEVGRIFSQALPRAVYAVLLLCGPAARAQDGQSIRIVVPFVAGGGVDVVARLIAPRLSEQLGQPVVVENKGGAGGALGAAAVAQAAPDGTTLLLGTGSTHGTNSSIYPKLAYDPVRDFVPVVPVSASPLVLIVPPALPAKSVGEFIALAREKPGELAFGSYGTGSINHLAAELFGSMAGIRANHIPYRGAAPAMTDLIAGRLHYTFDGVATSLSYARAGTIRLLGVTALERAAIHPDLPTIAEQGLPGFDATVWTGLFAPVGTAAPIADRLNRATNAVLAVPAVIEGFTKLGIAPTGGPPDALAARVAAELRKWASLVRERGIRVEP